MSNNGNTRKPDQLGLDKEYTTQKFVQLGLDVGHYDICNKNVEHVFEVQNPLASSIIDIVPPSSDDNTKVNNLSSNPILDFDRDPFTILDNELKEAGFDFQIDQLVKYLIFKGEQQKNPTVKYGGDKILLNINMINTRTKYVTKNPNSRRKNKSFGNGNGNRANNNHREYHHRDDNEHNNFSKSDNCSVSLDNSVDYTVNKKLKKGYRNKYDDKITSNDQNDNGDNIDDNQMSSSYNYIKKSFVDRVNRMSFKNKN